MSVEERTGVLDRVTEKGAEIDGNRLYYSKWFEGDLQLEQAHLGHRVTVLVDVAQKCTFIKRVINVGEKVPGWKPPQGPPKGGSGGFRGRMSPEEMELKRDEGRRIGHSVALDRSIEIEKNKIPIEKVLSHFPILNHLVQTGKIDLSLLPGKGTHEDRNRKEDKKTPPARPKSKRLDGRTVNSLFKEARTGGLVVDWKDFLSLVQDVLKLKEVKSPYHLSWEDFARVDADVRRRLTKSEAA